MTVTRTLAREVMVDALAAENSCLPTDLLNRTVTICERLPGRLNDPLRRRFVPPPLDIGLISLGIGGVASANTEALKWVNEMFRGTERDALFEPHRLGTIASRLRDGGHRLIGPVPRFAVNAEDFLAADPGEGVEIDVGGPSQPRALQPEEWPRALMRRRGEECPLKLVAIARVGGTIAGVAAAVADSDALWQIGIDVAPPIQGRGVGRVLASAITAAVLESDKVPYWCTNPANLRSIRTALSIGYKPAWLEVFTKVEPITLIPVTPA